MLGPGSSYALLVLLAVASPAIADVVVHEIMYNSPGTPDIEFVELVNDGPVAVDLTGWYLLDDNNAHDRCLLAGVLQPGELLVVAGRLDLFTAAYPSVTQLNPNGCDSSVQGVGFGWGNTSDSVRLFDSADDLVDEVTYEDGGDWPVQADGDGLSLELINPFLDNRLASSWAAGTLGGTPGAQNSVHDPDVAPLIQRVERDIELPTDQDDVTVTARALDDMGLELVELIVEGSGRMRQVMFDDGMHGDGAAGDGDFGATIPSAANGTLVLYHVEARDTAAQLTVFPPNAPARRFAYTVGYRPPPLIISEVLASNQNGATDDAGDPDDWLELHHPGPGLVDLGGMFIGDDLGAETLFELPATTLGPGETVLVWCDGEPEEGPLHADFTLGKESGEVAIFDTIEHGNVLIDGWRYGPQSADVSFGGRPEDAQSPEYLAQPSPDAPNGGSPAFSPIVINEFLAGSQLGVLDWVELYNRGGTTVDIGGWHLADDAETPMRYAFPSPTTIPPGGFLVVDQSELGFGFAADGGEEIVLTAADGTTGQDYLDYGPQEDDVSYGRYPDGTPNWHFFGSWTQGASNDCSLGIPPLGIVVGLHFDAIDAISWGAFGEAQAYDVVRGDLHSLLSSKGDLGGAVTGCVENGSGDTVSWDGELPASGVGWFYIVRAVNFACGFGTYDTTGASQSASRDPSIGSSPLACP